MKALVLYCHPQSDSYTAAVRDRVLDVLGERGAAVRLVDLYAEGFDPVMSPGEHAAYEDPAARQHITTAIADLEWCDTLIFVYPTWWYGLPAILKGWLDRVLVPGVAFLMPDADHAAIRPGLGHVARIGVFTTCGASWWLTRTIGAPGRRTLLRGVRLLCARNCRTVFAAHYDMDRSTPRSRAAHLERVRRKTERLIGAVPARREVTS